MSIAGPEDQHYRNERGFLGVPGLGGHYTCERHVRRWTWRRWPFRRWDECGAPATVPVDFVVQPEGFSVTFRYCERHAEISR